MHPVIIMAHEKSDALTAAQKSLEDAGMKVKVLMTGSAKMVDFLGALADVEGSEEEPKGEAAPKGGDEEVPSGGEEEVAPAGGEQKMEAIIDGERIACELTEGQSELYPSGLIIGTKTLYTLNECDYSFWPADIMTLDHDVQVQFGDKARFVTVEVKGSRTKPLIRLNRKIYEQFKR